MFKRKSLKDEKVISKKKPKSSEQKMVDLQSQLYLALTQLLYKGDFMLRIKNIFKYNDLYL